ncbi:MULTISPECIES: enoyl-CoA hydratase [unclassified Rhizobium]|uniref:enoyl-CoA hydratase n=1 Tax=unclassified Rhizobium TaxID=2613769 RepID=UPI00071459A0|nr:MULTISPECIES: enoyl-CoA hydratase [unclassified Rhizobium]KQS91235.1 enoyl-CoA hydratase [Rhizobium sp. Leaf391]KQS96740.1 enoyl-CoA hydratase [Rhizobium sp. Leaf386]KQU10332.1 enoyl-CoA hydratase [Rhizobium sp. Leaf453]
MEKPIIVEQQDRVVIVTLNRPAARNALNSEIMNALATELAPLDRDPGVGCFVLTGSEKAFAAGADIKEMADKSFPDMFGDDFFAAWDKFALFRTPKIAAVSGYALGGGCELAMMCDIIFASETAMFGQPEIKLGVIPGMGGSQRLTKLVGKSKAMDMILTGRMMDATEAERCGLVSRILAADKLMDETLAAARTIAGYGKLATMAAREAVDRALESGLREGILFERRIFHGLFATEDQKEGMAAFVEKRPPQFKGK